MNNLMNFNNEQFSEIRGIEINGEPYLVGRDVVEALGYDLKTNRYGLYIKKYVDEEDYIDFNSKTGLPSTIEFDYKILGQRGGCLINESGMYALVFGSDLPQAKEFKRWITKEVLPAIRKTGKFDSIENNIMKIEDEKEKQLSLEIYQSENLLKLNPTNLLMTLNLNQLKTELVQYKQSQQLEKTKVDISEIKDTLSKSHVLREGDMTATAIAKEFQVYSLKKKPHTLFAENLAKDMGIYIQPKGNLGYQDKYITVNLSQQGGQDVPTLKYSKLALEEMKKYIDTNGLRLQSPPKKYVRGSKKGEYIEAYMYFDDDRQIKVHELTYKLYKEFNK